MKGSAYLIVLISAVIFIYSAKVVYAGVTPISCSVVDQITDTMGGFSSVPSINSDGTRIAFRSSGDLTGGNGELNPNAEIFLAECDLPEPEPTPPSGPLVIIPTLSQWGMIFMSLLLGSFAVYFMRRRTQV